MKKNLFVSYEIELVSAVSMCGSKLAACHFFDYNQGTRNPSCPPLGINSSKDTEVTSKCFTSRLQYPLISCLFCSISTMLQLFFRKKKIFFSLPFFFFFLSFFFILFFVLQDFWLVFLFCKAGKNCFDRIENNKF